MRDFVNWSMWVIANGFLWLSVICLVGIIAFDILWAVWKLVSLIRRIVKGCRN